MSRSGEAGACAARSRAVRQRGLVGLGAALVLFAGAPPAGAQASAAPAKAPSKAASPAPEASSPAEDHIFALVQAGKCSEARAAADRAGDANLAGQIGLMCGARSNAPASKSSSSHGRGGGGAGGSRRGGG